jgi:precorrin-6B methylase 2
VGSLDGLSGSGDVTNRPFTEYDVQRCLYDTARVNHLNNAIKRTVREGDVVIDAGSGTGVLGMLAVLAGAAKVYCLELNPEFIPVIEQNARTNGMSGKIVALEADATTVDIPGLADHSADVILSEVISAGFFYEPQLQILNHLQRYLKPTGTVVPLKMRNFVELIDAQDKLYGLKFSTDSRFVELGGDRPLTTRMGYHSADFRLHTNEKINGTATVNGTRTGMANAIKVTYDIEFSPSVVVYKPTDFLLNSQIIFLPEPVEVTAGRQYEVRLDYVASSITRDCTIEVAELPRPSQQAGGQLRNGSPLVFAQQLSQVVQ